jgi:hypothetical protein
VRIQLQVILAQVRKQVIGTQYLGYLDQLVIVIVSVEERLLSEDHSCYHASQGPHIQAVIVVLKVYQQLRTLEITGGHTHIVLSSWVVKFSQSPIDESQAFLFVINDDVMGLDIPVHDAIGVAVVQGDADLVDVESDVKVRQGWIQKFEIRVGNVFEHEARCLAVWVTHDIKQADDVGAAAEVLKDLNLTAKLRNR